MITRISRPTALWITGGAAGVALVLGSAGVAFASQGADDAAPHASRTAAPTTSAVSTPKPTAAVDDHGGLRTTPEGVHHHRHGGRTARPAPVVTAPAATTTVAPVASAPVAVPVAPSASPAPVVATPSTVPTIDDHGVHAPGIDDHGGRGSGSGSSGHGSDDGSGHDRGDDHGSSGHGSDD